MDLIIFCKRFYTNKDLIKDKFGRIYNLPHNLTKSNSIFLAAANYRNIDNSHHFEKNFEMHSWSIRSLFSLSFRDLKKLLSILKNSNNLTVISSGDTLNGLIGFIVSIVFRTPFFFDVYDDYREFTSNKLFGGDFLFNFLCKKANGLIVASDSLKKSLVDLNRNICVIENGYDPLVFNAIRSRSSIKLPLNAKVILYSGTIDDRIDIHTLIEAFSKLTKYRNDIYFVHAGVNLTRVAINYSWYIGLSAIPQDDVAKLINIADICIAPYKSGHVLSETCNPCKLSEYMACQRPIIAADLDFFLNYHNFNLIYYKSGDPESLADKIESQLINPIYSLTNYANTWEKLSSRLESFIKETTSQKKS